MMDKALLDRLNEFLTNFRLTASKPSRLADVPTDEDMLGYTEFAQAMAEKIASAVKNKETPFTIGIHGAWGSGKTSFLKLIEKELGNNKIKPIWFNAWKYNQEDNLWSALLQRILDQAPLNYNFVGRIFIRIRLSYENWDLKSGGFEAFKKLLSLTFRILLFALGVGIGKGFLTSQITALLDYISTVFPSITPNAISFLTSKVGLWIPAIASFILAIGPHNIATLFSENLGFDTTKLRKKRSYKNHIAFLDEFNEEFRKTILLVSGKKPLVVFIDDMDRCLPEKALQILEAIKLFLDVENCVFVVAVDRDVIEQSISARYAREMVLLDKNQDPQLRKFEIAYLAQNYIEKIIQLPFTVPPLPTGKIKEYVEFLYDQKKADDGCIEIFAEGLPPNPRKIKRVIQSFLLLKQIATKRLMNETVNYALLAKLVIIENQFRAFHQDLVHIPALLEGVEREHRKEENNLPVSVMAVFDRLELQEKVNVYKSDNGLKKLLLQKVTAATFIGVDVSEYVYLLKTVSDETVKSLPDEIVSVVEKPIVDNVKQGESETVNISGNVQETINFYNLNQSDIGSARGISNTEFLRRYLNLIITSFQYLHLQGFRGGNKPDVISLEDVYVPLETIEVTSSNFAKETRERKTILELLRHNRHQVIIGDPGSGKTILFSYLALAYARDRLHGNGMVKEILGVDESDYLPVILPLRNLGWHLKEINTTPSKDGPGLLINYLREYYQSQNIDLPAEFFISPLESGKAILLLDGLDEIAEFELRSRAARIIETIAKRYPNIRILVSSRVAGYVGSSRLSSNFSVGMLADFNEEQSKKFIRSWIQATTPLLPDKDKLATKNLENKLLHLIQGNPQLGKFATSPILLTVTMLVYSFYSYLPERRSMLYEAAVDMLLSQWDEAKGLQSNVTDPEEKFPTIEIRISLERIAYWLQKQEVQEIINRDLITLIASSSDTANEKVKLMPNYTDNFIQNLIERSGLFIEIRSRIYGFISLGFQEYLTARYISKAPDVIPEISPYLSQSWWREVIVFLAGNLSIQGMRKTTNDLISTILSGAKGKTSLKDYYTQLAYDCLMEAGEQEVDTNLVTTIKKRMNLLKKRQNKPDSEEQT